jgi:hypothetical protein
MIDMRRITGIINNHVLPTTPLPNSSLARATRTAESRSIMGNALENICLMTLSAWSYHHRLQVASKYNASVQEEPARNQCEKAGVYGFP